MPILQSRVLALISAGRDYQRALRRLQEKITAAEREAIASKDPYAHARALQQLQLDSQELFLLSHPLESGKILDFEEEKLRPVVVGRNERARNRIAKLRRTGELPSEARNKQQGPRLQKAGSYYLSKDNADSIDAEARQAERDEAAAKAGKQESGGLVEAEEGQVAEE